MKEILTIILLSLSGTIGVAIMCSIIYMLLRDKD